MLIRMPAPEHIELPNPRRLLRTTAWSMAESVGLPFGTYVAVTDLVSPDAGLLAGTAVVWLLIVARRIVTGSVTSLLMISAVVLTIQTAVAVSTGYLWMSSSSSRSPTWRCAGCDRSGALARVVFTFLITAARSVRFNLDRNALRCKEYIECRSWARLAGRRAACQFASSAGSCCAVG